MDQRTSLLGQSFEEAAGVFAAFSTVKDDETFAPLEETAAAIRGTGIVD